jgi:DnaJ-class molecular chaperone
VGKHASEREITKAYRALAKKWHPDKHRTDGKGADAQAWSFASVTIQPPYTVC